MKANSAQTEQTVRIEDLPSEFQIVARTIGIENALELARKVGGERLYIPRINVLLRGIIYRAVKEEFNGSNYRELAQKYGYTVRWIRAIVQEQTGRAA